MEAALDSQSFGQILNRIWRLLRSNIKLFAAIASLPLAVGAGLYGLIFALVFATVPLAHGSLGPALVAAVAVDCVVGLLGFLAALLISALYEPAASYAALQADAGVRVTFRQAYGVAWRRPGRYLWLLILRQLIILAPIALLGAPLAGLWLLLMDGNPNSAAAFLIIPLVVLFYAGAIVWSILATIRMALAYPASVAEDLTAWDAICRSNRVSQGGRLRIFLVALVIYGISLAVILGLELIFFLLLGIGMLLISALHLAPVWTYIGLAPLGLLFIGALILASMCMVAAYSIAFAVLYRDQVRLEQMAAAPGAAG